MKIVIVSDTHGSRKNIENVCECNPDADMLIHLGDVEGDEDYIPAVADCPVHMVRGNNDFFFRSAWRRRIHGRGISYIYNARTRVLCIYGRNAVETGGKRARSGYCDVWPYASSVL